MGLDCADLIILYKIERLVSFFLVVFESMKSLSDFQLPDPMLIEERKC